MPRLPRILLLVALLLGALAACKTSPPPRFPEITFRHLAPIRLDVREVTVEQAYKAPLQAPNVDHLFPVRPAEAAERWGQERLIAAGVGRRVRYIVHEASVTETPLKTNSGIKGALTVDQSERYEARVVVELQIIGDDGRTEGKATVRAERSTTVAEDVTLHEREEIWFKMTEALMKELDAQLQRTIQSVFSNYIVV